MMFVENIALEVRTEANNLLELDPKLKGQTSEMSCFYLKDLTEEFKGLVAKHGITDGLFTAQLLHTTGVLAVNELDEPMLVGDISNTLQKMVSPGEPYLHNSKLRTKNLCEEDNKCDRNAHAHIQAFSFGSPSVTLVVQNGELVLGRWQRVALIDLDGPRVRKLMVQIMGVKK